MGDLATSATAAGRRRTRHRRPLSQQDQEQDGQRRYRRCAQNNAHLGNIPWVVHGFVPGPDDRSLDLAGR